jgi:O-antigen ligase
VEVRLSPQLHSTIYGYFPHSWRQQLREGGFRPVVFLGHGLVVALFIAVGFAFLATLNKVKIKILSLPMRALLAFSGVTLVLCKTYSAIGYGLFLFSAISILRPKKVNFAAMALASIFMAYPVLKMTNLFPEQAIVNSFATLSEERASSLAFRFNNENLMLDHARDKLLFGWGEWGRNRVFDSETGDDLTVIDGYWISIFGAYGFVGFISIFFFFVIPIFLTYKNYKRFNLVDKPISRTLIPAHALILAVILFDQTINASLANGAFYWFLSGALYGRICSLMKESQTKT